MYRFRTPEVSKPWISKELLDVENMNSGSAIRRRVERASWSTCKQSAKFPHLCQLGFSACRIWTLAHGNHILCCLDLALHPTPLPQSTDTSDDNLRDNLEAINHFPPWTSPKHSCLLSVPLGCSTRQHQEVINLPLVMPKPHTKRDTPQINECAGNQRFSTIIQKAI